MKQLSIIIPMYNVAQYLETCIASVYNQGIEENDFEVILIDDESPDNSLEVAQKLTQDKTNVVIISQKNKGLGGARNTGIEASIGNYILFLDSDDWYLPRSLSKIITIAETNKLDILEFGAEGIDANNKIIYRASVSSNNHIYNGVEYYQKIRYMDSACNKLYNRNFLSQNKLLFLEKLFIEDYEFNTKTFCFAKRVMAIDTIVANFLQTPNSITRNTSSAKKEKMILDIKSVIKKINDLKIANVAIDSSYFNQRLSYLTATLFYQLYKNKSVYSEYTNLKKQLEKENLFFVNYTIFDKSKNMFRIVFLKNFFLLKMITKN